MGILREYVGENTSSLDLTALAREVAKSLDAYPGFSDMPVELVQSKLRPSIQFMLAQGGSSIKDAVQIALNLFVTQLTEDPRSIIPDAFQDAKYCPYPGLAAFDEGSAPYFWGREEDITAVIANIERPLLAIIGPSGVGKSSLLRAGVIPKIREQYRDDARILTCRLNTSTEVRHDLARELFANDIELVEEWLTKFDTQDSALFDALQQHRLSNTTHVFLIVDQFEELFVGDELERSKDRKKLLDNLLYVDEQQPAWATVILSIRPVIFEAEDYKDRPRLQTIVENENFSVRRLDSRQLRQAIEKPLITFNQAYEQSLRFQPGLVDLVVKNFAATRVELPLVQYLLRLLWVEKHHLTHFAYNTLGGLERALDRHATEIYKNCDEQDQPLVKGLLIALVRPGIDNEYTRKRIGLDEALNKPEQRERLKKIIRRLSDESSRIISEQHVGQSIFLEITHEILLRQWEFLHDLIDVRKERIQHREQLLPLAQQWVLSVETRGPKGDGSYLYRGEMLKLAQRYVADPLFKDEVDSSIAECLVASEKQQRRNKINIVVSFVVGIPALIAIYLVAVNFSTGAERQRANANATAQALAERRQATAVSQQATAEAERIIEQQRADTNATAEAQSRATAVAEATARANAEVQREQEAKLKQVRQLVAQAEVVRNQGPDQLSRSLLLSIEAARRALDINAYTVENDRSLRSGLAQLPRTASTFDTGMENPAVEFSQDEQSLIISGNSQEEQLIAKLDGSNSIAKHTEVPNADVNSSESYPFYFTKVDEELQIVEKSSKRVIEKFPIDANNNFLYTAYKSYVAVAVNNTLQIVGLDTGKVISQAAYQDTIRWLRFSPDGTHVAAGTGEPRSDDPFSTTRDSSIYVWATTDAQEIVKIQEDLLKLTAFSPDGRYFAFATGDDGTTQGAMEGSSLFRVYDLATGQIVVERIHEGAPWSIEFSPDSRLVVVTAPTHSLALTDIATNTDIDEILSGYYTVFSNDGQFMASVFGAFWNDESHTVVVWNTATKQKLFERQITGYTNLVGFLNDNKTIVVNNAENVFFYDFTNNSEVQRYEGSRAILSPSKKSIAITSGSVVSVRQLVDKAQSELIVASNSVIDKTAFSGDDKMLVTVENDTLNIWRVLEGAIFKSFKAKSAIRATAFNSEDNSVSALTTEGLVQVWDVDTGDVVREFQGNVATNDSYYRKAAQFSSDGKVLTIIGADNTITVWSLTDGKNLGRIDDKSTFAATYKTSQGYNLFVGHEDGSVAQYGLPGGSLIREFPAPQSNNSTGVSAVVVSSDGKQVAVGISGGSQTGGEVVIWNMETNTIAATYNTLGEAAAVELSNNNQYVSAVGANIPHMVSTSTYNASVWQIGNDKELFLFGPAADSAGSSPNAHSIAFGPDSKYIAVGFADGTTHILPVEQKQEQKQETANIIQANPVGYVFFSHSGKYIGIVDRVEGILKSSRVSIWRPEDLIEAACQRLSRNFTEQEWKQYFSNEPYHQTCTNLP